MKLVKWVIENDREQNVKVWHTDEIVRLTHILIESASLSLMNDPMSVPQVGHKLLPGLTELIE